MSLSNNRKDSSYRRNTFRPSFWNRSHAPNRSGTPIFHMKLLLQENNDDLLKSTLDLLEEKHNGATVRVAAYQQRIARYYNKNVKVLVFK
ncbi:hypothetical protein JRO89_XS07G0225000 [Xanthoceras sorbifolium]|uniref:Uncharacterized protein n=1 Tax=Xanthoceras sorbifolium TaxID=99658 RepID=A0ABQ8HUP2_9ROSI|nr:hypothetical protein JRO89_XS07G0225000 [Xanthoceras sorbifolium]